MHATWYLILSDPLQDALSEIYVPNHKGFFIFIFQNDRKILIMLSQQHVL